MKTSTKEMNNTNTWALYAYCIHRLFENKGGKVKNMNTSWYRVPWSKGFSDGHMWKIAYEFGGSGIRNPVQIRKVLHFRSKPNNY